MASRAKEPNERALSKGEMRELAIAERGGQCLGCPHKKKLMAIDPPPFRAKLTPATIAVQVDCQLDGNRKYPHKGSGPCRTIEHYHRRQFHKTEPAQETG